MKNEQTVSVVSELISKLIRNAFCFIFFVFLFNLHNGGRL